ncbi:MAG: heavy metal translocating P-type ATPase, partial [Fimbriimonadales bacterium]|nr:heavy metal translocating P-type ATPase [Fimbriimonadales bacterium]
ATETLLHRILQLVEQAQEQKARTQRWLERFEQRYALAVIGGAALVASGLPLLGWNFADAFYRAMTLLVVASPCALVISTPATLLSAIANAARRGILFKGGEPIERLATVRALAIDKTGTLTEGKLEFTDLIVLQSDDTSAAERERRAWQVILDVESRSEHPLAQALVRAAHARGYSPRPTRRVEAVPGKGIRAVLEDGSEARIGNLRLFEDCGVPDAVREVVERVRSAGNTAMVVWADGQFLAVAAAADKVRPEAAQAVAQLHALGIPCVAMLTGDAEPIARAVAQQTGMDRVYADLLPHEKLEVLHQLSSELGATAMVGDGVNDAPALAAAEVGIAMGAGTDVALETADIALVGNDLSNLPYAVALSRRAMQVLKQNLLFATGVIVALVILTFVANLRLPLGVVGHEGSTLIVVLNGLRLLVYRPPAA